MEDLNNFLKDAIASDEYTEHTVSLNEDCEFINGAFYEDFITEANFNDLIVSSSCEDVVNLIIENKRPDNNDWTKRLGL